MATVTRMPELAANTPDATLTEWLVKAGDRVNAGDAIATVETAKATVDIEAEASGVVLRLVVEAGQDVLVGAPILVIGEEGEDISGLDLGDDASDAAPAQEEPSAATAEPPAPVAEATEVAVQAIAPSTPPQAEARPGGRIFASPLARKLAREGALALDEVTGSGPHGRIVRRDVVAALAAPRVSAVPQAPAAAVVRPAAEPAAGFVDVPHSKLRKAIAARLTQSKREAPHFYLKGTAEVTELLALRRKLVEAGGAQVSVNDLVVKAVARAHQREPRMNTVWTEGAIRTFESVDIAVAVATDNGLVTPVIRGAEKLSLSALASATRDFAKAAREGTIRPADLEGGTVTVSNLGMFGTQEFSAIINPPHASILAVGAAVDAAVVRDGEVVAGRTITFMLSVDHRPVDGAVAAAWMREFLALIESPLSLTV